MNQVILPFSCVCKYSIVPPQYFLNLIEIANLSYFAATSFRASQIYPLIPLLEVMPDQIQLTHPFLLNLMRGLLSLSFFISYSR